MPCKICNTLQIYLDDNLSCPKCQRLAVVPYEDSIKIVDYYISVFKKMFENEVKKYNKTHVIVNTFWQREKQIRKFYQAFSTIDVRRLVSCNLLMRRVIQMDNFLGQEIMDEIKINEIIKTYGELSSFEEDRIRLEAGNWSMLHTVKYDLDHLELLH